MQLSEAISLTKPAMLQVAGLMAEEKADDPAIKAMYLRIAVKGGGCSGFQYNFSLADKSTDKDQVFDLLSDGSKSEVLIAVDHISYMYLGGSVVDFKEDAMGARFVVNNPNASTTCSCGDSFAAD